MASLGHLRFEWDDNKNEANRRKHLISFEEAVVLFSRGVDYLELFDEAHSSTEDRFICIGPIDRGIVLVVTTEPDDDVLRIISARFATRRETDLFHAYGAGGER